MKRKHMHTHTCTLSSASTQTEFNIHWIELNWIFSPNYWKLNTTETLFAIGIISSINSNRAIRNFRYFHNIIWFSFWSLQCMSFNKNVPQNFQMHKRTHIDVQFYYFYFRSIFIAIYKYTPKLHSCRWCGR